MRRHVLALLCACLAAAVCVGCGPPAPQPTPRAGETTGTVGMRLADIDRAIKSNAYVLPALVKGLARDLKELRPDFTGDKTALDAAIARLEDWHKRSNDRRTDADADREELKTILDDVRSALKTRPDAAPDEPAKTAP